MVKPAKSRTGRATSDLHVPAAAARAALDFETKAIRRLQRNAARNFWTIGRRLSHVAELKLHRARGFSTLDEYAEKVLGLSRGTAFQYIRVASAFSEEVAASFGPEKLDRALAYITRTPADEKPSDIPTLRIHVPASGGAPARDKPFAEVASVKLVYERASSCA